MQDADVCSFVLKSVYTKAIFKCVHVNTFDRGVIQHAFVHFVQRLDTTSMSVLDAGMRDALSLVAKKIWMEEGLWLVRRKPLMHDSLSGKTAGFS